MCVLTLRYVMRVGHATSVRLSDRYDSYFWLFQRYETTSSAKDYSVAKRGRQSGDIRDWTIAC
jgi:hypothetical protein